MLNIILYFIRALDNIVKKIDHIIPKLKYKNRPETITGPKRTQRGQVDKILTDNQ